MIPRTVHRVWVGGEEPAWTREFADTWQQPGWEVVTWTEEEIKTLFPLHNQRIYDQAESIAPNNVGQLRGDVLRYEILQRFGGVYVDTDFECLKPIDPLIEGLTTFAAWEAEGRWINNAIMGSEVSHPLLNDLVDNLQANVRRKRSRKVRPNVLTGPQYLTPIARRHGTTILPKRYFYPYLWNELTLGREHFPDAYAIHHWANQRRERGIPLNA